MRTIQFLLYPVSLCYGILMMLRNWLFTAGILRSREFKVPVICVGNLSAGGTGKTPHIEYLIRLLSPKYLISTLSRGYKRETKGFVLASKRSTFKYIGDEPLQFARKFPDIKVAVDGNRVRGIETLLAKFPSLGAVLLDDGFQHRRIAPGLSILLTDYHKMYTEDKMLPTGTLREFKCSAKRADIIVVTKTPKIFSPITRRRILDELRAQAYQTVVFSYISYGDPLPLNDKCEHVLLPKYSYILLFTGIANDYPLKEQLERQCTELVRMKFQDHHPYTAEDLKKITTTFDDLPSQKKAIFTTEKDMMRLKTPELLPLLKGYPVFYVPIEIRFHGEDKVIFEKIVTNFVEKA